MEWVNLPATEIQLPDVLAALKREIPAPLLVIFD